MKLIAKTLIHFVIPMILYDMHTPRVIVVCSVTLVTVIGGQYAWQTLTNIYEKIPYILDLAISKSFILSILYHLRIHAVIFCMKTANKNTSSHN